MRILLIGNYEPDAQESMLRYAGMLRDGLASAGYRVTLVAPRRVLNRVPQAMTAARKWLGYVDKLAISPLALTRMTRGSDVVHICDHSNAMYVPASPSSPHVVTCHDLLAVRGALGEDTDCPASAMGRVLQRSILKGLSRAAAVACVSRYTLSDVRRLLPDYPGKLAVVPNALNYPYGRRSGEHVEKLLGTVSGLGDGVEYVLNIGSNLRRKNRAGVLRAIAAVGGRWRGKVVFAGQPLSGELWALARQLRLDSRVVEVVRPSGELLEALYNKALALLFPSRFEGFGWPIIEAQACGCPVICSDREPLPEVAGTAAVFCPADDEVALGDGVVTLSRDEGFRVRLIERGAANARRYQIDNMIGALGALYTELLRCA